MMPKTDKKVHPSGTSLRLRVFGAFALFAAVVLLVMWLFQTVLLDDIYYVNGGPAIFGGKKISLEERTEIVRWAEAIVTKLS